MTETEVRILAMEGRILLSCIVEWMADIATEGGGCFFTAVNTYCLTLQENNYFPLYERDWHLQMKLNIYHSC